MSVMALMGGGMPSSGKDESDDSASDDEGDDEDLAALGAKYAQRFGEAVKAEDWPEAFKAFGRMRELCGYEEQQEHGY